MPLTNTSESQVRRNLTDEDALALGEDTAVEFRAMAAPATPPPGSVLAYAKSDGRLYSKNDAGAEHALAGGATALIELSDVDAKTGGGTTAVMQDSPTIITPAIGSFANAAHDHESAAGGGALDAAAIASGTLGGARLAGRHRRFKAIVYIENPSAFEALPIGGVPDGATLARVIASTDAGTVTFNLDIRDELTPFAPGTNVWTGSQAAANPSLDKTTFDNQPGAAKEIWITTSGASGSPGKLEVKIYGTIPD